MAKAIFGACEVRIKIPSDLWFLHPSPPPTHDTVVEGTVLLSLPNARKVKKLDVELVRLAVSRKNNSNRWLNSLAVQSTDRTSEHVSHEAVYQVRYDPSEIDTQSI